METRLFGFTLVQLGGAYQTDELTSQPSSPPLA